MLHFSQLQCPDHPTRDLRTIAVLFPLPEIVFPSIDLLSVILNAISLFVKHSCEEMLSHVV
jgi:hypothetical protein